MSSRAAQPWITFDAPPNKRYLVRQYAWFGTWFFLTAVGLFLDPHRSGHGTHEELGLPPCPCVLLFNRPCPGCGLTTSWTRLLHGNIVGAFQAHPLGPVLYALFTASAIYALVGCLKGRLAVPRSKWIDRGMLAFAAIFLIFGVARFCLMPNYGTLYEHLAYQLR